MNVNMLKDVDPFPFLGLCVPLVEGCEDRGVCNRWTGRCHCPFDFTGEACDVPVMPACMLQGAPFDPYRWLGDWMNEMPMDLGMGRAGGGGGAAGGRGGRD